MRDVGGVSSGELGCENKSVIGGQGDCELGEIDRLRDIPSSLCCYLMTS